MSEGSTIFKKIKEIGSFKKSIGTMTNPVGSVVGQELFQFLLIMGVRGSFVNILY